jgi:hypothetical protein
MALPTLLSLRPSCLNPNDKAAVERRSFQPEEAQAQSDEK